MQFKLHAECVGTSEVLKVISSSPGDLKPVFGSMLEKATRICGRSFGSMLLREGDRLRRVAVHNAPQRFSEFHETTPVVDYRATNVLTRIWTTKKAIHIADLQVEEPNDILAKYADARTVIAVPLLKNDELLVSQACKMMGYSRDSFYRFKELYDKGGELRWV